MPFSTKVSLLNWLNWKFDKGWYDEKLGGWTSCMGKVWGTEYWMWWLRWIIRLRGMRQISEYTEKLCFGILQFSTLVSPPEWSFCCGASVQMKRTYGEPVDTPGDILDRVCQLLHLLEEKDNCNQSNIFLN